MRRIGVPPAVARPRRGSRPRRPTAPTSSACVDELRLAPTSGRGRARCECRRAPTPISLMMLRASLRFDAANALTDSDGWRQLVSHGWRAPPSSCDAGKQARLLAELRVVGGQRRDVRCSAAVSGLTLSQMPGRLIEPSSLVERRQHLAQRHRRIGHRPAPHARVQRLLERAHLDVDGDQAAQRGGDRRQAGLEVAGVGEDDGVGGEERLVRAQELGQVVGADLLFALDDDLDVERQRAGRP